MALLTKYVDKDTVATGGNGDVGDKWKYLWEATGAIKTDAGNNQYLVYVKWNVAAYGTDEDGGLASEESDDAGHDGAGGDAGAVIYLDQAAGGITVPNVFEGYHTTPGDGGIVEIDCQGATNQLTNGIWVSPVTMYTVFKNFDNQNASGDGVEGAAGADQLTFKNVRIKTTGGFGWQLDNNNNFVNCIADNCGSMGIDADNVTSIISCILRNNTTEAYKVDFYGVVYNTLIYDNGNVSVAHHVGPGWVLGCTLDGNNEAASVGIRQDDATNTLQVANSIIYDFNTPILSDGNHGELVIARNNLYFSNNNDNSAFLAIDVKGGEQSGVGNRGDISADPAFTGTYLPGANGQNVALDHVYTDNYWKSFDPGGDNPPEPESE